MSRDGASPLIAVRLKKRLAHEGYFGMRWWSGSKLPLKILLTSGDFFTRAF